MKTTTNTAPTRKLQTWINASGCRGRVVSTKCDPRSIAKRWTAVIRYSGEAHTVVGSSFSEIQGRYMDLFR